MRRLLWLWLVAGAFSPTASAATVTLVVVKAPASTPADATLTLGANLNGWNPGAPGFAFTRDAGGRPVLVLDLPAGTLVEYKVTRGSWETVERSATGTDRANRTLEVGQDATVDIEVEAWATESTPSPSHTIVGTVERIADVRSNELGNVRDLLVYLPPSYGRGTARYPVLYMQDGQNVFDEATAFIHREWKADEAAEALARRGGELIIVAIANVEPTADGAGRLSEYSPFVMSRLHSRGDGARYAEFMLRTLKPMIDARYRTIGDRAHTGVAGSSMGGLISLFMALRHPDVFGFAAALSPSLWFADGAILEWARANPPSPTLRVYLDAGTQEGDNRAEADEGIARGEAMSGLLRAQGNDVRFVVAPGAHHDEDAWAARLPPVLEWFAAGR